MTAEPRRDSQSLRLIEVAAVYSTEELEAWAARIVREEIADAEFDADGNQGARGPLLLEGIGSIRNDRSREVFSGPDERMVDEFSVAA